MTVDQSCEKWRSVT